MKHTVTELRKSYNILVPERLKSSGMGNGDMLTTVFNGLFVQVYQEYCAAMDGMDGLDTPKGWRKIDVIRESGALQVMYNSSQHSVMIPWL